ncbi:unnamed protein product [Phytophthora lilii]|uniref:Unnamed protein product n=1 Tax=Phytophthora lilii TaxID=2077276 RepID=A0A9W6U2C8_9STRA|nr:unnamed protein product [Phytophthora lilii]
MLHKRAEGAALLHEKAAEGFKPEQMTMEHVNACVDLVESCNEAVTANSNFLLKAPVSRAEHERRRKAAQQRHQDQVAQLNEILNQCSKNVEDYSAAAIKATKNTEDMMVSVRENTEAFMKSASCENQSAVNRCVENS